MDLLVNQQLLANRQRYIDQQPVRVERHDRDLVGRIRFAGQGIRGRVDRSLVRIGSLTGQEWVLESLGLHGCLARDGGRYEIITHGNRISDLRLTNAVRLGVCAGTGRLHSRRGSGTRPVDRFRTARGQEYPFPEEHIGPDRADDDAGWQDEEGEIEQQVPA
jgi:hypothetical protein